MSKFITKEGYKVKVGFLRIPFAHYIFLVLRRRLELPRGCLHRHLKPARLPIPPPHGSLQGQKILVIGGRGQQGRQGTQALTEIR